jgi:hypothetical protein
VNRHLTLSTFACLGLLGPAHPTFAQEARFRLSLAWTVTEIEPAQRTRLASRTLTVALGKGGAVREHVNRNRGGRGRVREGALGDDLDARARWKVLNETTLLRLVAERSHTFAIWLRTDGARSCWATLEWRLKPGFAAYEGWARRRDVPIRYRQPTVQQATCEVL